MQRRLNQRITQALGRCNRAEDDYAVYVLADRRFATHLGRESNRTGISKNVAAEIDMAEDMAEIAVEDLETRIASFLGGNFDQFDQDHARLSADVRMQEAPAADADLAEDEVLGWTAMFDSQNYTVAADRFRRCWERALGQNWLELGAFYGWCLAKALYLASIKTGDGSREDALAVFEDAIRRGGAVSWFNRMRSSLNRARGQTQAMGLGTEEYELIVLRAFDNMLEQTGRRFDHYCDGVAEDLHAAAHNQYCQGIEKLGRLLGFDATRPRHGAATDCRWRGAFSDVREVLTVEAKVEHEPSGFVTATHIGQAHNQVERARAEFAHLGYQVNGVIVTHLSTLADDAEASAGPLRCISKDTVISLWDRLRTILTRYRAGWSLDDIAQRRSAAASIRPWLPGAGWIGRALTEDPRWIPADRILQEWGHP